MRYEILGSNRLGEDHPKKCPSIGTLAGLVDFHNAISSKYNISAVGTDK